MTLFLYLGCVLASDKAIELDAALDSHTVQYMETQREDSDKPCVIPVQGSI
jgi:advillin